MAAGMDDHSCQHVSQQIRQIRAQVLQSPTLPFDGVLSESVTQRLLREAGVSVTNCVYTPLRTLQLFLWQCLSADASCQNAVFKLAAHRAATGQKACSSRLSAIHLRFQISQ